MGLWWYWLLSQQYSHQEDRIWNQQETESADKETSEKKEDKEAGDKPDDKAEDKTTKEDGEKKKTDEKAEKEEVEEEDFIEPLQFLVKYISWDHGDTDYYLNNIYSVCCVQLQVSRIGGHNLSSPYQPNWYFGSDLGFRSGPMLILVHPPCS